MEPFTHAALGALAGASVTRVAKAETLKPALAIGALAGLFPDIDILVFLLNPLHYHAYWHGTYTHSLVLAPAWALLFALVIWLVMRLASRRLGWPALSFAMLYGIGLAGICTHIAADLLTAWDIGVFLPLNDKRVSFGLLFIVDPVFSASILLALSTFYWQRAALSILALLPPLCWIAFAGIQKQSALDHAHIQAHIQAPFQAATKPTLTGPLSREVEAWPQPFSLYHWKLLLNTEDGVWAMDLRVTHSAPVYWPARWMRQSAGSYRHRGEAEWHFHPRYPTSRAETAWQHPDFSAVRDFMSYPAYLETDDSGCTWFTDLLFVVPQLPPPFQYALCTSSSGATQVRRR